MILKFFELGKKKLIDRKYLLFYGSNKGLIQETIKNNFTSFTKDEINKYDENEIIKNKDSFLEDVNNKSFFETKKLIIISRCTDKIFKIVEEITEKNIDGVTILLLSETLEKKSKLRNFFEKSKNTICVAFYEDNLSTLNHLASNFFKEKKISLSQQNINFIIERSRGDRINLYNELEKIENFSRNKKQLRFEEILKLTNLSENFDLNELVDFTLAKNQKKTLNILNENNFGGDESILILRIFLRKLKRLLKIQKQNQIEGNIEKTILNFKPPIFWKEKELVKMQLKIWNYGKIQKLLNQVNMVELQVKKNPSNSINLVTDFILNQAQIS